MLRLGLSLLFGLSSATRAGLHAHALYTLALWTASRVLGREQQLPLDFELPRIAALVVAHDEASVIEACVRSLRAQKYPSDRFDLFVVADNCSDDTAALATRAGARVFQRASGGPQGKPVAVAHGVSKIREHAEYAAIALFDADNVVDPDFLPSIAARIATGERVVQGFVDAKNPDASWVARASAIGFWVIDEMVQRPRERLGLSAALMGTGFAARPDLFPEALAVEAALADDIEANARLALRGVRVAYEPKARTLDEKPTRMASSIAQRERWMQGRWATVERWLPELLGSRRPSALDVAVQLVSPSILFSASALGALSAAELVLRRVSRFGGGSGARASLGFAVLYFLFPAPGIARHHPNWGVYLMQPAYLLRSVPIAVRGWFARRRSEWGKSAHGDD